MPFAPSPSSADYPGLLFSAAFESMIAERWMRLNEAGRNLDQLAYSMQAILERYLAAQ